MKHIPGSTAFDGHKHSTEAIGDAVDALSGGGGLYPVGETYFVDGVNGNDADDGTTLAKAKLTIDAGIALCSDNENDYIFIAAAAYDENAAAAGVTVDVEGITMIGVGKGQATVVNSNAGATAVFTVTSDEFDMSGLQIIEATNTVEGMLITGDASYIHGNEFIGAMENGIQLSACADSKIEDNYFNGITNDGVEISGVSVRNKIEKNKFFAVGDNAINLNGNGVDGNSVSRNIIDGAAGTTDVGINIVLGDNNSISNNFIGNCTFVMNDTGSNNSWVGNQEPSQFGAGSTLQEDIRLSGIGGGGGSETGGEFPMGDTFYVTTTGNDANDGTTWAKARLTIDAAIALCAADNNDYIFVAPGAYDEDAAAVNPENGVTVDIAGVHIVGMGLYQTTVENSLVAPAAVYVFNVTADHVEITGFSIIEATNTVEGIFASGDYCDFHDNRFDGAMENAIQLSGSVGTKVYNNYFNGATNDGIEISGVSRDNRVFNNNIIGPGDTGIHLNGNNVDGNYVHDNIINGNAGTTNIGISIVLGDNNIISNNFIGQCTYEIVDTGTANVVVNNHQPSLTGAGGATVEQDINVSGNSPKQFPLGNVYFVAKTGLDANDGTSWAKAKLTIDAAIPLCTANNNDYIFVAPGSYDEDGAAAGVTVDVEGIHLIGANIGLNTPRKSPTVVNSLGGATAVFTITASVGEIAGFNINETTATVEGIVITADTWWVHHNVFEDPQENAIRLTGGTWCVIEDNVFQGMTNDAIELAGGSTYNLVRNNKIFGPGDTGIHLNGDAADRNWVYDNHINGNAGTTNIGISIVLGDNNIISNNFIGQCTYEIVDTGTANVLVNNHQPSLTGAGGATIEQDINVAGNSTKNFPVGNVYFVTTAGADTNDGTSWAKAMLTIDAAIVLCTANNNDYIFVGPGSYDEDAAVAGITVDVAMIHIIGAGIGLGNRIGTDVENSNAGATAVFTVPESFIEIAGFEIVEGVNTVEGILTGDYNWIHDCSFNGTMENGVHAVGGEGIMVERCVFRDITNDGIELSGAAEYHTIKDNDFIGIGDNAIHLNGDDVDNNRVHHNRINGSAGTTDVGINIALGDNNIISNNFIGECVAQSADTGTSNAWVGNSQESGIALMNSIQDDLADIYNQTGIDKPFPMGDVYYVSTAGNDANAGTSWAQAMLTIDAAIALCTADNNDYIFVAPGAYDETGAGAGGVAVDIANIHLIGAGDITRVDNGNVGATTVFTVSVNFVEIAYINIIEESAGVDGITLNDGENCHIHDVYFSDTMENGLVMDYGRSCIIENNRFLAQRTDAIITQGAAASNFNIIRDNLIRQAGTNGINLGANGEDNLIENNKIDGTNGTTDVGINVAGDRNMINDNRVGECSTSSFANTGSNNIWLDNHWDSWNTTVTIAAVTAFNTYANSQVLINDAKDYPRVVGDIFIDCYHNNNASGWHTRSVAGDILTFEIEFSLDAGTSYSRYDSGTIVAVAAAPFQSIIIKGFRVPGRWRVRAYTDNDRGEYIFPYMYQSE